MIRQIVKNGNSMSLVLSKDMRDHLGLTDNQIEVTFERDTLVLSAPKKGMSVEEATEATLKKYDSAFRNLA
jgi:antitoxin component of MazEF toxin-antitoxin module